MPVYNGEKYLKESLNSIINQTISIENLQVIVVNDCSTDSTKEILDNYHQNYPSIEPIHLPKNSGGPFTPRNLALNKVKAPYIMFLDADDQFKEDSGQTLYNKITQYNLADIYVYIQKKT